MLATLFFSFPFIGRFLEEPFLNIFIMSFSSIKSLALSILNSDSLQNLHKQVNITALSADFQATSVVLEEFGHRHEQTYSTNEELKKAQNKFLDLKKRQSLIMHETRILSVITHQIRHIFPPIALKSISSQRRNVLSGIRPTLSIYFTPSVIASCSSS